MLNPTGKDGRSIGRAFENYFIYNQVPNPVNTAKLPLRMENDAQNSDDFSSFLLVFSHIAYAPALIPLVRRGLWGYATQLVIMVFVSMAYHIIQVSYTTTIFGHGYEFWALLDLLYSLWGLVIMVTYILVFQTPERRIQWYTGILSVNVFMWTILNDKWTNYFQIVSSGKIE